MPDADDRNFREEMVRTLVERFGTVISRAHAISYTSTGRGKYEAELGRKGSSLRSKSIGVMAACGVGLMFASVGWAGPAHDVCAALGDARTALKLMVIAKNKPAQEALDDKVQVASNRLDFALSQMTGGQAKVAADFRVVWDQFKQTREKKIVPAIHRGDIDEAERIANGIQYVRLSKMWSIMSCK